MTEFYTRQLTGLWDSDVIVVGSGSAGATAAIAAARSGARTTLVERFGFLGGTSTQVLDTFYGFYTPGSAAYKVVGGIPDDVVNALKAQGAAFERPNSFGAGTGVTYDPVLLKVVWEQLALGAGVRLLMHSFCTDVLMDGDRITGVIVDGKRGLLKLTARAVIDCTGDADVCHQAGAAYEHAGEIDPAQTLTTTFRLSNVDVARAQAFGKKALAQAMEEAARSGLYDLPRREGSGLHTAQMLTLEPMLTDTLVQRFLSRLAQIGLVRRDEHGEWLLARDLDDLVLGELYEACQLRVPMGGDCLPCRDDDLGKAVHAVIDDLRLPLGQALARSVGSIYPASGPAPDPVPASAPAPAPAPEHPPGA